MSSTADEKATKRGKSIINLITPDEKVPVQEKPKPAPDAVEVDPVDQNANIEEVEPDLNEELVDYNDAPELTLDTTKAAKIELRDALAKNGLAMRQVLKEHPIKTYYTHLPNVGGNNSARTDPAGGTSRRSAESRSDQRPNHHATEFLSEVVTSHHQSAQRT
jgi:hypothetical protein